MAPFRLLRRVAERVHVVRGLDRHRWVAAGRALVWVPATRVALGLLPWRRVSAAFDGAEPRTDTPPNWPRAKATVWAVEAVCRRVLPDRPCLTQALVARHLLRASGVETDLKIGGTRNEAGEFRAHAWLEHEGKVVVGHTPGVTYVPFEAVSARAPSPELGGKSSSGEASIVALGAPATNAL